MADMRYPEFMQHLTERIGRVLLDEELQPAERRAVEVALRVCGRASPERLAELLRLSRRAVTTVMHRTEVRSRRAQTAIEAAVSRYCITVSQFCDGVSAALVMERAAPIVPPTMDALEMVQQIVEKLRNRVEFFRYTGHQTLDEVLAGVNQEWRKKPGYWIVSIEYRPS